MGCKVGQNIGGKERESCLSKYGNLLLPRIRALVSDGFFDGLAAIPLKSAIRLPCLAAKNGSNL